jgi:glycosyltransferase involved in cell wall biosynthesis
VRGKLVVLPCGVNMKRFTPIPREQARRRLGLDPEGPYLLFPADPGRREKRYDRALAVAGEVPVLVVGQVDPGEMPFWINAANAVLVPSERESFGLSVLEALACDVPVLATPVGVAPEVLPEVAGTHCGPFDAAVWRAKLASALAERDPRVPGRSVANRYSADRLAERVFAAWRTLR